MFRAGALLALCCGVACASCALDCETTSLDPVEYNGGKVDPSQTTYETSAWDESWLHFPPGRRFVLVHGLPGTPYVVNTYLSFSESPLTTKNNASESAGNQAVIESVTERDIQLRNDSCADFYLRVTAAVAPSVDAGAD